MRALLAALLALAGCCLTDVSGLQTPSGSGGRLQTSSGTGSGASKTGSSTGTATGGSTASTGTATGATSTASTGGATSGTSTGSPPLTLPPTFLMDAGPDTIFGPVAITAVPRLGSGAAKLAYSAGDGGQYSVMAQTLSDDGVPVGDPTLLAMTGVLPYFDDAGTVDWVSPQAPPNVAISDDGTATEVCWEDWGTTSNPNCQGGFAQNLVLCSALEEAGGNPVSSYSNCGLIPQLAFNSGDGVTQLFFIGVDAQTSRGLVINEWAIGQSWNVTQTVVGPAARLSAVPLPNGWAGVVSSRLEGGGDDSTGLYLSKSGYADGGYFGQGQLTEIDPTYENEDSRFNPVVATSSPSTQSLGVLEHVGTELLEFAWQVDAGTGSGRIGITSTEPILGAIAVGACPNGFAYFAATEHDTVLFVETTFDGQLVAGSSKYLELQNFNQTPGLNRSDNLGYGVPATTFALAPAPGGKLFLAISNPAQIAVYLVSCE